MKMPESARKGSEGADRVAPPPPPPPPPVAIPKIPSVCSIPIRSSCPAA